jgi:hypothetical protein
MKNYAVVLAMMLMTATAMGQTSRREANIDVPVNKNDTKINNAGSVKTRSADPKKKTYETRDIKHVDHPVPAHTDHYASSREFRGGREVIHHYSAPPRSREYRRIHDPYREPVHFNLFWTPQLRFEYIALYPAIAYYKYPIGYRIMNISAYDAMHYRGEIVNIYGRVYEVYYSRYTDEYLLYFGAYFPYHDFTAVLPGEIARQYSPWPERYFEKDYMVITGLVTQYEGSPEIVVRSTEQIRLY